MPHSTKENSLEDSSFLPEINPAGDNVSSPLTEIDPAAEVLIQMQLMTKTEKPSVQPISQPPIDLSQNSKNKKSKVRKRKNVSKQENSKNDENQGEKKRTQENTNVKILSFIDIEVDVREGKRLRKR